MIEVEIVVVEQVVYDLVARHLTANSNISNVFCRVYHSFLDTRGGRLSNLE
jgi:hypothetical protein